MTCSTRAKGCSRSVRRGLGEVRHEDAFPARGPEQARPARQKRRSGLRPNRAPPDKSRPAKRCLENNEPPFNGLNGFVPFDDRLEATGAFPKKGTCSTRLLTRSCRACRDARLGCCDVAGAVSAGFLRSIRGRTRSYAVERGTVRWGRYESCVAGVVKEPCGKGGVLRGGGGRGGWQGGGPHPPDPHALRRPDGAGEGENGLRLAARAWRCRGWLRSWRRVGGRGGAWLRCGGRRRGSTRLPLASKGDRGARLRGS